MVWKQSQIGAVLQPMAPFNFSDVSRSEILVRILLQSWVVQGFIWWR